MRTNASSPITSAERRSSSSTIGCGTCAQASSRLATCASSSRPTTHDEPRVAPAVDSARHQDGDTQDVIRTGRHDQDKNPARGAWPHRAPSSVGGGGPLGAVLYPSGETPNGRSVSTVTARATTKPASRDGASRHVPVLDPTPASWRSGMPHARSIVIMRTQPRPAVRRINPIIVAACSVSCRLHGRRRRPSPPRRTSRRAAASSSIGAGHRHRRSILDRQPTRRGSGGAQAGRQRCVHNLLLLCQSIGTVRVGTPSRRSSTSTPGPPLADGSSRPSPVCRSCSSALACPARAQVRLRPRARAARRRSAGTRSGRDRARGEASPERTRRHRHRGLQRRGGAAVERGRTVGAR